MPRVSVKQVMRAYQLGAIHPELPMRPQTRKWAFLNSHTLFACPLAACAVEQGAPISAFLDGVDTAWEAATGTLGLTHAYVGGFVDAVDGHLVSEPEANTDYEWGRGAYDGTRVRKAVWGE